jgi:hypothetical protein
MNISWKGIKKMPILVWAYPEEFKDKNSAGQIFKGKIRQAKPC